MEIKELTCLLAIMMENRIEVLGTKHGTDKITHHQYHLSYEIFLSPLYEKTGAILEIGVNEGASLNMWLDLFPNAFIYGMDIDKTYEGTRHKIFQGDQSRVDHLERLKLNIQNTPIWFINDDGSHVPEHQILTFNVLFPTLEEGGVYIIEDIETSYWSNGILYGYNVRCGYKHPDSIVEIFKDVADAVNSEFAGRGRTTRVQHQDQIGSITFAPNCIIIVKRTRENRPYRYAVNL